MIYEYLKTTLLILLLALLIRGSGELNLINKASDAKAIKQVRVNSLLESVSKKIIDLNDYLIVKNISDGHGFYLRKLLATLLFTSNEKKYGSHFNFYKTGISPPSDT